MSFTYEYPRPALTADCGVFGFDEGELKVLLIQRKFEPFKGRWAFPGGFVEMDETLDVAAHRELAEETGMTKISLEQLHTFGDPGRDPRGRVVSVAYYGLVKLSAQRTKASSDAHQAVWFAVSEVPKLAFDHNRILSMALGRLKGKVRDEPIGFELLPRKFTIGELQHLYEVILEAQLDKRKFRKTILSMDLLLELNGLQKDTVHRAARLYRFDERKYQQLKKQGFNFEL